MSKPFFSVVIPCYNSSAWVRQALDSVFQQDFSDYEIIVVDDGSTDNTLEILKSTEDRISVYQQENAGAGSARNLAICHAQGDYIILLDSDDLWPAWTLSTVYSVIQSTRNPVMVAGKQIEFTDEKKLPTSEYRDPLQVKWFDCYYEAISNGIWLLYSGAIAIQRSAIQRHAGFAEGPQNAEDTHLFLKLGMERGFVKIEAPEVNYYRRHGSNSTLSIKRGVTGVSYLIAEEKRGVYPGGESYRLMRRDVITKHARSLSVACVRAGQLDWGMRLYHDTLSWNLALRHAKYVVGFPMWALWYQALYLLRNGLSLS